MTWHYLIDAFASPDISDVLLVPGNPPLARVEGGFTLLSIAAVSADSVGEMMRQVLQQPGAVVQQHDDYFTFDVGGKAEWLRVSVFKAAPEGRALFMRMPPMDLLDRESHTLLSAETETALSRLPIELPLAWGRLLETTVRRGRDLILLPGAPPLVRVPFGLRAMHTTPVVQEALSCMLEQIRPEQAAPSTQYIEDGGHYEFNLRYGEDYTFRVAVWTHDRQPEFLFLARIRG